MLQKQMLKMITTAGLLLAAPLAGAHEGLHAANGLADGLLHPLTGLDHLLVTIAAGAWAVHQGRVHTARLAVFVAMFTAGLLLADVAGVLPLLALLVLATAVLKPCFFPFALFGSFACWHGMLHLQAMPVSVTIGSYVGGLLLATVLLLATGVAGRLVLGRRVHAVIERNPPL
jgi:urease accessory protein